MSKTARDLSEQSDEFVRIFGAAMRELNDADEAFREQANADTFMRFMRARQAYFILAKEADRKIALAIAGVRFDEIRSVVG